MSVTASEDDIKVYSEDLYNGEVDYEASRSEAGKLIKETVGYLEGIEEDNKEIAEYIDKLQKEYDIQQQKNKTESAKQEGQVSSKKSNRESTLKL